MKQFFYAAVFCVTALAACTTPFKKASDGSEYKIISNKSGAKVIKGDFMEMNSFAKYKDSTLASSIEDGMPQYAEYDTTNFPVPFKEIFKEIHVGDSIVLRVSTDSIMAKGQAAPFMKKGQFIYQSYTIVKVYKSKEEADKAQKTHVPLAKEKYNKKQMAQIEKDLATNKSQLDSDSKLIEAYLKANNITATKTKWGTYVQIKKEGTGPQLTSSEIASVNYTGRSFDSSKVFDSNTDPKFNHVQPIDVNLGQYGGIILGWPDALLQMKRGTVATLFIPSSLAYGKEGKMPAIKPNQILVFDMEVVSAGSEEEKMAQEMEMQKRAQQQQQKMMDSLQKNAPKK